MISGLKRTFVHVLLVKETSSCMLLVELALEERNSKNAGVSFSFFFGWDLNCRPDVPSGDRGNWG